MKIAILSLARSGSTLLYYILSDTLGGKATRYFEPTSRDLINFNTNDLLVKMVPPAMNWEPDASFLARFDHVAYLVRDPRDRMISSLLFGLHGGDERTVSTRAEILRKKEQTPAAYPFVDLVQDLLPHLTVERIQDHLASIHKNFLNHLSSCSSAIVLRFEDMIHSDFNALEEVLGAISRAQPIMETRHLHGSRIKIAGDWKNWLTAADQPVFEPVFAEWIERFDYDPDWTPSQHPAIRAEHASDFILRAHRSDKTMRDRNLSWRDT